MSLWLDASEYIEMKVALSKSLLNLLAQANFLLYNVLISCDIQSIDAT